MADRSLFAKVCQASPKVRRLIRALGLFIAVFFLGGIEEVLTETSLASLPGQQLGGSSSIQQVSGICPQKRKTHQAPSRHLKRKFRFPRHLKISSKESGFMTKMLNQQLVSYAMERKEMGMDLWQEGWILHQETLPVPQ